MIDQLVGKRLRKLRDEMNFSLDDVARLTGVSKPSLSNIERGTTSTSINNLWKISTGLSLPISYFFTDEGNQYELVSVKDQYQLESENDLVAIFTTFTWQVNDSFETFFLTLQPNGKHQSKPHASGVTEIIIVTEGQLTMALNDELVTVTKGQLLRFQANVEHYYANLDQKACSFYAIMSYPHKGEI